MEMRPGRVSGAVCQPYGLTAFHTLAERDERLLEVRVNGFVDVAVRPLVGDTDVVAVIAAAADIVDSFYQPIGARMDFASCWRFEVNAFMTTNETVLSIG